MPWANLLKMLAGPSAQAVEPWNTTLVPIRGSVTGSPETVVFSGAARVESRLAKDPDFSRPKLVIYIDLSGVSGVGSLTKKQYVIQGSEILQRRLSGSQQVEFTFPFVERGSPTSVRSGVAAFALNVDTKTGAVTSAGGTLTGPSSSR